MEQKFIKVGSSTAAVIPKFMKDEAGIESGGKFKITREESTNRIIIEPRTAQPEKSAIDPAILQWTNEFIDKNHDLLSRLKDK